MIYILFEPMEMEKTIKEEKPLFEINKFAVYEYDRASLKSLLRGTNAKKFAQRYEVDDINYTDNTQKYLANMSANSGVYKNEETTLFGNVRYKREDGLVFEGEEALYDKKLSKLSTNKPYVIYKGNSNVVGSSLEYNAQTNKVKSTKIKAIYELQESKK
jgi:LPS export ABC transporter protein LptC